MRSAAGTALTTGAPMPQLQRSVTQEAISRYADTSGDHNPLHIDPEFAATTQFKGTIAHGMLVLAFLSEMLTAAFGHDWLGSGRFKVRFRGAARPGDIVTVRGTVTEASPERIKCQVECVNQGGDVLVSGEAEVPVQE